MRVKEVSNYIEQRDSSQVCFELDKSKWKLETALFREKERRLRNLSQRLSSPPQTDCFTFRSPMQEQRKNELGFRLANERENSSILWLFIQIETYETIEKPKVIFSRKENKSMIGK